MNQLDPTDPDVWQTVRATLRNAQSTSLHCAVASTGADGRPHITPIGSFMLTDPGRGLYLDVFNVELGRNLDRDPCLAVMAIDSGRRRWLSALLHDGFDTPPGFRLIGTAGPARPMTDQERDRFRRRVRLALRTPGGRRLWGGDERFRARDIEFTAVVPVRVPGMTAHLWASTTVTTATTTGEPGPHQPLTRSDATR